MQIARAVTAFDQHDPAVDQLVEDRDLDVLQLDYRWPQAFLLANKSGWTTFAPGFLKQLRSLHKSLYLDPNLHLITNAGGGNTQKCIEAASSFLCEQGDADLPITAIRGDNVLSQLEELIAAGIELNEMTGGQRLQDITQPILAAQIEIGAGPIATALSEKSRIVIAGCYDSASPAIAASVSAFDWPWENVDALANVAAVSQMPFSSFEVEANGCVTLQQIASSPEPLPTTEKVIHHADVAIQLQDLKFPSSSTETVQINGIEGQTPNNKWRLCLTCEADYRTEALFDCENSAYEQLLETLQTLLHTEDNSSKNMAFERLERSAPSTLLRVSCSSEKLGPCEEFVRDIINFSLRSNVYQLIGILPRVERMVSQKWFEVPRDAIAISVDTRPAKEWR